MSFFRETLPNILRIPVALMVPGLLIFMATTQSSGCSSQTWSHASCDVTRDVATIQAMDSTVIIVRYPDGSAPIVLTKDDIIPLRKKVP